jgi:hypothetical protein
MAQPRQLQVGRGVVRMRREGIMVPGCHQMEVKVCIQISDTVVILGLILTGMIRTAGNGEYSLMELVSPNKYNRGA